MPCLKYYPEKSSPKGKQKVYFCGHPYDVNEIYWDIRRDIMKARDCVVFRREEGEDYTEEAFFSLLSEMRLFVVPVTTRLLTQPNDALEREIPIALDRHIPILPLMLEDSLEELYTRHFGDLPYLETRQKDPTATSYEKRFADYLRSVLIGNELARQVRESFSAYIFLGYRKKDRACVRKLMCLIHQNDFCRDVAVWYDEYLTPDETFTPDIRGAIRKSRVFALAVTPCLTDETNYVMTEEYPAAREAAARGDLRILAAEMRPTDRAELEKAYPDVPPCVDAHDAACLSLWLSDALRGVEKKSDSPRHRFLIGLAYLSGIDVETDAGRGASLIRSAAEEGLPEAMEKLAAMYHAGDGVTRDSDIAVQWLEKLAETHRATYTRTGRSDDAILAVDAFCDLGNALSESGHLRKAKSAYETALSLLKNGGAGWKDRYRSIACGCLGGIAKAEGDLAKAKEWYEKELAICLPLAEETKKGQTLNDLTICYIHLGDLALDDRRFAEAKAYYVKYGKICRSTDEQRSTVETQRALLIGYDRLGAVAEAEGNLAEAREYYGLSVTGARTIVERSGDYEAQRCLTVAYIRLSRVTQATKRYDDAKKYSDQALESALHAEQLYGTVETKRDLAAIYGQLGDIAWEKGDRSGAKDAYGKEWRIAEELAKTVGTVETQRDLVICYNRCARTEEESGHTDLAKDLYEKTLAIALPLSRKLGTVWALRDLAVCYAKLGNCAQKEERYDDAKDYYEKGLAVDTALSLQLGTDGSRWEISTDYDRLGGIACLSERHEEADKYYAKALSLRLSLVESIGTKDAFDGLASSFAALGRVRANDRDLLRNAAGIYERLCEAFPDEAYYASQLQAIRRFIGSDE